MARLCEFLAGVPAYIKACDGDDGADRSLILRPKVNFAKSSPILSKEVHLMKQTSAVLLKRDAAMILAVTKHDESTCAISKPSASQIAR